MYSKTGLEKNQQVAQYAPLVKRIAYHLMARLPASVQVDDLIQVGMIGLLDAMTNYNDEQGAQFETYAVQRIRGAMLDELRQSDWLPRSARKTLRQIEAAMNALEQRVCRAPTEREVADELRVSLEDYQQMLLDARGCQLLHYEDFQNGEDGDFFERHCADDSAEPFARLQDERFRAKLIEAISVLPEREKLMMAMYYEEEMNLREIGEVLGVSESRVCQVHSQAMARLRSKMKEWI
ncbi:MAG: RNA polymerase sigma factor FliA [Sulfuricella sp.]|nr:RNA polymerase sigma factor FliA [Sulfuricella sp.]